jgi:hypothetical protein
MEADMFNIIVSLGILLLSISFSLCGTVRRADRILLNRDLPDENWIPEEEDTDEADTDESENGEPTGPLPVADAPEGVSTETDALVADAPIGDAPEGVSTETDALVADAPVGDAPEGVSPETDEIPKPELDYLKAQLAFYRGEKEVCEAKMRNPTITLDNYELLKKHWDGLTAMITGLEEVIA